MNKPLVSVLICTYNAEQTIIPTLESCLNQTYKEFEILILDNWSKDKTREIIENIQKDYNCIKLYYEWRNLWAYDWLNYLIDKSKWKYIAIQDHDDIWHSKKIELQVKFLEKNGKYAWCWTGTLVYYLKSKIGYLHSLKEWPTDFVMHTSLMFRNKERYRYYTNIDYMCDSYFMKKILSESKKKLYIINKPLALHLLKENWWNYSDQWFSLSKEKVKRYFTVYWLDFYYILIFIYLIFIKMMSIKTRSKIDLVLTKTMKWAKTKKELGETNEYCKEMLKYF